MSYKFGWKKVEDSLYVDITTGLYYVRKQRNKKSISRSTKTTDLNQARRIRDEIIKEAFATNKASSAKPPMPRLKHRLIKVPSIANLCRDQATGFYYVRLILSLKTKDHDEAIKLISRINKALEV